MKTFVNLLVGMLTFAVWGGKMEKGTSVKSVIRRAEKGESLTVVFFGGSLTWGANASDPAVTSFRGLTMKMLQEKYPHARWKFADAAIGGTGSTPGVFRMERDVLRHKPDLIILDFTLNDGLSGSPEGFHDRKNQSYEAILRLALQHDAAILPVFLTDRKSVMLPDLSTLKRRLEHIRLCHEYSLEYADVLGVMNQACISGRLDIDLLWPPELFDITHPHDAGYAVYADCFFKEWQRISSAPEKVPVIPEKPLCGSSFAYFSRIDLPELKLSGWRTAYPYIVSDSYDWMASRHLDKVAVYANGDHVDYFEWKYNGKELAPFSFKVRAEQVAVMMEIIPQSAAFAVSVNGGEPRKIPFRKVMRSQFQYAVLAGGLEADKLHTITVIPENPPENTVGVMRWGALLLNGSKPVELNWK